MSVFSVVAARKGSKGLKEKVLRKINGKYIFEYSIEYSLKLAAAIKKEVYTVVSSDSELVEKYCLKGKIPFIRRNQRLASDKTRIEHVIYDAYRKTDMAFEYISLVYGNMPLRHEEEFVRAFNFLETNRNYDAVLSMQNVEKYNPDWIYALNKDKLPHKKTAAVRRQDLKQRMIHDGHTVLTRSDYFINFMREKKKETFMYEVFGGKIKPMLNDRLIIDIDTEKDLKLARLVAQNNSMSQ